MVFVLLNTLTNRKMQYMKMERILTHEKVLLLLMITVFTVCLLVQL
jgi:Mn2+/Fe2+ NRAMP family transporter